MDKKMDVTRVRLEHSDIDHLIGNANRLVLNADHFVEMYTYFLQGFAFLMVVTAAWVAWRVAVL